MKKLILSTLLASTLVLTACEAAESEETPETEEETVQEDTSDQETTTETDDTSEEETDESEETVDEEESEVAEAPEYLYEVSDNFAYINVLDGKEANKQVALLTFDDGPNEHTLGIAEILADKDAPAIFFVNSMYLEDDEGKDILKEVHEMGFTIGNHTHTHASLPSISEDKQTEEIIKTNDMVEEIIGVRPRFFRAPFGQNTDHSKQVVKDEGMALMNWTYGYDWEADYQNADALADIMVNTNLLVSGSNLLMHDREWTKEATPAIIDGLREKDYELLDPELIQTGNSESEEMTND
ncbi:Peptidoglycan/xylan/chitin deacetylase, PgdA/CDA1 family [Alkalibacterium subtropicum]|uniref:Peptidoglycan/xylan/chitin deacetylase, PgdA/CDA1 family n=1 Tax=Alkalibacterium subtropicum TaxID=753702 RepID=A0A1I1JWS5_9LACT|nr:polysaccharide deacetylase family protein [Alkalibacterium subtropicum]SFC52432.1 Peptidoglycan/xylan/chitin deacetylase, PgdA/CDA1 family [Alkalibacterium subtropicum]